MTVKLTDFGSTDWIDGDVLYAADQNSTLKSILSLLKGLNTTASTGSYNVSYSNSGSTHTFTRGRIYHFKSFSMTNGTITTTGTGGDPLIIFVDGNVTFSGGTIDLSAGTNAGLAAATGSSPYVGQNIGFTAGIVGADGSGGGGGGAAGTSYLVNFDAPNSIPYIYNLFCPSGGNTGGTGAGGGGAGGAGGRAGGVLLFLCTGNFSGSGGTINLSGGIGTVGTNGGSHGGGGGGGGGSGGLAVIAYKGTYSAPTFTITAGAGASGGTGTTNTGGGGGGGGQGYNNDGTAGGNAGVGAGATGGNGGTGKSYAFQW